MQEQNQNQGGGAFSALLKCKHTAALAVAAAALAHTAVTCRGGLTQLVEVCVATVGSWHRADQTGLEECGPFVDQTPLAAHVILMGNTTRLVFHHLNQTL